MDYSNLDDFELVLSKARRQLQGIENNIKGYEESLDKMDEIEYKEFRNFMWRLATITHKNGLNCNANLIQTPIKKDRDFHYAITVYEDLTSGEPKYYLTLFTTSSDKDILDDRDALKFTNTVRIYDNFKSFHMQMEKDEIVAQFYCEFMAIWEYAKAFVEESFIKVATNDMAEMIRCAEDELDEKVYEHEVMDERIRYNHYTIS